MGQNSITRVLNGHYIWNHNIWPNESQELVYTIKQMSEYKFKKIVKEKTVQVAFNYLMEQKNTPGKHTKIKHIEYKQLCMQ
jgi:hypothetical protein